MDHHWWGEELDVESCQVFRTLVSDPGGTGVALQEQLTVDDRIDDFSVDVG